MYYMWKLHGIIGLILNIYACGLILWAILSWIGTTEAVQVRKMLDRFYEPVLSKIRRKVPPIKTSGGTMVDLSPIVLLVAIGILAQLIMILLPW